MFLERLQDLMRIQAEVAHDLAEHVPFDLRKRQKDMLVRQQCMLTPTGFLDRAIDNPLCCFAYLAR